MLYFIARIAEQSSLSLARKAGTQRITISAADGCSEYLACVCSDYWAHHATFVTPAASKAA
ncbi:hypothetical protein B5M45_27350 [Mycobacterium simiae]|uniref:Uncharacterized protein n=1 Tax=Mycobacterium simiae TaxID=1784 RepID=A0A1X0XN95_MYCSI|nr:hypothetical protein B5M45_27350 [Mycobacterium simiae]